ncbi:MAG TPA: PqqD family protein [Candidatus Acidoferrum sp.]|nr:PqqD family protein [Candidatus Acidoferrum sp.]
MSEKCYVARASKIAARMLGDEMMVMVAPDSTLFSLNEVAALIFNAADGATPLDQIVEQRICVEFDVNPDVALRDAQELVKELASHGVLITSQEPIPLPRAFAQAAR